MRKLFLALTVALLGLAGSAWAVEFQPLGTLGIGGAGVARQNGALTAYWNPAGGAFNEQSFSFITGAEVGMRGNDALTQNIDRLHGIDFNDIKSFNGGNQTPQTIGDVVKLITIMSDIEKRDGHVAATGSAPVGFAIKHFSFGLYGNFEGYVQPLPDTVNILPTNQLSAGGAPVTATDLYNAAVPNNPAASVNNGFFSPQQYAGVVGVFTSNGLSPSQAAQLTNAIEAQMAGSGIPASTVAGAVTGSLNQALSSPDGSTLNKNTSSVLTKGLLYVEAPLAYGHPIPLGSFGVLGIGASVKAIRGTVYQSQVLLVNTPSPLRSSDLANQITHNQLTTNTWGVDLGALWKYQGLAVGVVGKNLNRPRFEAPTYQEPYFNPVSGLVESREKKGSDVTLDPQARAGLAYDPWRWLTIAADLDLTENSSVVPAASLKSRNLGGGLELHPYSWLKFRLGAYKNLADSGSAPVATAGLSLGPFDLDGAVSTGTFKYGSETLPEEARVSLLCGFSF